MPALNPQSQREKFLRLSRMRARRDLRRQTTKANRQIGRIEANTERRVGRVNRSYAAGAERIANTSLKGLQGRYKQDVQQEIAQSLPQLARAGRHHAREYERQGRQMTRPLRQGIRQETRELAANYFQDLREQAATRRQERSEAKRERVTGATEAAAQHYATLQKAQRPLPKSEEEWRLFQAAFEAANPLMPPQLAERAVAQLAARVTTQAPLPPDVAGPTIREARPDVQRQLRRQYTRDYMGR